MRSDRKAAICRLLALAQRGDTSAIQDALHLLVEWPPSPSPYEALHVFLDVSEDRDVDPTMLIDLAQLFADAHVYGAMAESAFISVGHTPPEFENSNRPWQVQFFTTYTRRIAEHLGVEVLARMKPENVVEPE